MRGTGAPASPSAVSDGQQQSFYDEIRLRAVQAVAEPLYRDEGQDLADRLAEAERRLRLLLAPWGGLWVPDRGVVAEALRSAGRGRRGRDSRPHQRHYVPAGAGRQQRKKV